MYIYRQHAVLLPAGPTMEHNKHLVLSLFLFLSLFVRIRSEESVMKESKGVVKHLLLAKFKDSVSEQQIQEYIREYANLINLVPSLKAFRWGKNLSTENLNQGFEYIFESSFRSTQGVAEYLVDPDHVAFANKLLPQLDKVLVVDYQPTKVHL